MRTQVLADPSNQPDEPDNVQTRSDESLHVQGTLHCYVRWDVTQHLIFALVVQLKPSECSEVSLANLKLEDCQLGNNYQESKPQTLAIIGQSEGDTYSLIIASSVQGTCCLLLFANL